MILQGAKPLSKALLKEMEAVHTQGRNHMSRDGQPDLLKTNRPNEDKATKEYRDNNIRRLSRDGINSFYALFSRLFANSGIKINQQSDKLKDYLATKPFKYGNKSMSLFNWFYTSAMWDCGIDPNGVFIVWPEKKIGSYSDKSIAVSPQTKFFSWEQRKGSINYNGEDWLYYAVQIQKDLMQSDYSGLHEHWLVNETKIAVYRDVVAGNKNETILVWEYVHNFGVPPVVSTVSMASKLKSGDTILESILSGYFEFADWAMNRLSDAQVVGVMHDYPIRIMLAKILGLKCSSPTCTANSNKADKAICKSCNNTGWDLSKLGATSTYVVEDDTILDKPSGSLAPISYAAPDPANTNNSFDKGFELLERANKSLGIDLVGIAAESGVAREMRFEEIQDKLGLLALNCKMFIERQMHFYEGYLELNEANRVEPIVFVPRVLKLKNAEVLREEAMLALPIDKMAAQMAFIEEKYMDDPNKVKSSRLSFLACPSLLCNEEELINRTNIGLYSKFEWYKRDILPAVMYGLVKDSPDQSDEMLIKKANDIVKAKFGIVETDNGETDPPAPE